MPPPPPVTHLRLFGSYLCADSTSVRWMLRYSGHEDSIEHVEVDVLKSENLSESFAQRNHFQTLPVLEVELQCARSANAAAISATKKEATGLLDDDGSDKNAPGRGEPTAKDASDPTSDGDKKKSTPTTKTTLPMRSFTLTTPGAIMTFLVEHFKIPNLGSPRSPFLRCRSFEMTALHEVLGRRVTSMFFVFLFTKAAGTTDDDITAAIQAHERELMWSFRLLDDTITANERRYAAKKGLDYDALLELSRKEAETYAHDGTAKNHPTQNQHSDVDTGADDAGDGGDGSGDAKERRPFVSPTLLALDAYICGDSLSLADFPTACDLNALPYLQSWLPPSLRIEHFPALLRYITRMQNTAGHHRSLKPVLAFLKRFRRRPKMLTGHPVLSIHAVRVQQASSSRGRSTTISAEKGAALKKSVDTKRRAASSTLSRAPHFVPSGHQLGLPASSKSASDGTVAPRCRSVPTMSSAYTYTNERGHCTFGNRNAKDSKETTSSTENSDALIGWGALFSSNPQRTVGRLSEEDEARLGQPHETPTQPFDGKKKHPPPHRHQQPPRPVDDPTCPHSNARASTSRHTKSERSAPSGAHVGSTSHAPSHSLPHRAGGENATEKTQPPADLGSAPSGSSDDDRIMTPPSHGRDQVGGGNVPATATSSVVNDHQAGWAYQSGAGATVAAMGTRTGVAGAVAVPHPKRSTLRTFEAPPPAPTSGFNSSGYHHGFDMHHLAPDGRHGGPPDCEYASPPPICVAAAGSGNEHFDGRRVQHRLRTAEPQPMAPGSVCSDRAMMMQAQVRQAQTQSASVPPLQLRQRGAPTHQPPFYGHGQEQHQPPHHQGRRARNPYQGSSSVAGPMPPTLMRDAQPPSLSD